MSIIAVDIIKARTTGVAVTVTGQLVSDELAVAGVATATGGFAIGIQSASTTVATAITALNFVGSGNTIIDRGSGSIDIAVGGISSDRVATGAVWSNPSYTTETLTLTEGTNNYSVVGDYSVAVGATITVGAGCSFVVI